jgi:hypothetical protein
MHYTSRIRTSVPHPQLTSHHVQRKREAAEERAGISNPPRGFWDDVCIVHTHQRLPREYRAAERSEAARFLATLRGVTAGYNSLDCYMLQIVDVGFAFVTSADYADCGDPLEQIWQAHLTDLGGFEANKDIVIFGGSEEDLAVRDPNYTFADVLPHHLLPPANSDLFLMPEPIPVDAILDMPADSSPAAPADSTPAATASHPGTSTVHAATALHSTSRARRAATTPHFNASAAARTAAHIPPAGFLPTPHNHDPPATASNLVDLLAGTVPSHALEAARAATAPQRGA